ncbi:hypothetical protein CSOJ01_07669 [Colletotrichum sojae]|uniref:Acyl-CoA oxidase C-alpha1 domain-containing protein n=1 Tax=Colletotrichum sojae TaxID=2175907 RepID=A0A8H6J8U7_9PEZI|nr:hypothetical protein CSOJ01_07669 [Colletotrichum sojae]
MLCQASGLTVDDIHYLTPRFWQYHFELISARDPVAFTITSIHLNLCIGSIARALEHRPDLAGILEDLQSFNVYGEFMLTEIGHGLDVRNLETTATMLEDGSFVLNTPTLGAAKFMPPTTLLASVPRLAVVFARLIVQGEDRGVKQFVVPLCDADRMLPGIVSRALPIRPGTKPFDHAVTMFDHVRLQAGALLGSAQKAEDERADFLDQIWRVSVGTLSLSIPGIAAMKIAGSIAAIYSQRRRVGVGRDGKTMPILGFSPQQRPILKALAHAEVLHAYAQWTIQEFMNTSRDLDVRRGLAAAFKALVLRSAGVMTQLVERCGAQGLFAHNQINEMALFFQGNSIAEGDTQVLCIRPASEILFGKYALPEPRDGSSPLAQYETGLFEEATLKMFSMDGAQRGESFNAHILPRCRNLVEAIGQRMAYEAALHSEDESPEVLDVFVMSCMREDASWFVQHGNRTRAQICDDEEKAYGKLLPMLPMLPELVERTGAKDYITAPIVDEDSLKNFVLSLQTFGGKNEAVLGDLPIQSKL